MTTKICTKCKVEKLLEQFIKNKRNKDGRDAWCRQCWRIQNSSRTKERYRTEPEYKERMLVLSRKGGLRRKYGITLGDYCTLLTNQNGCCKICGSNIPGGKNKYFSVDHDHKTGKVRGLLCTDCNHLLGNAKDDSSILKKAIDYLETGN